MRKLFILVSIGMLVSAFLIGCGKGNPRPGDVLTPGGYRVFSSDWDKTEVSSQNQGAVTNNSGTTVNSSGNQNNNSNNNGCSHNCAPKK